MVARPNPAQDDLIDELGDIPGVHVVTPEEGLALFDQQARKTLGISGDEFLRRWDEGAYQPVPDTVEGRAIGQIAMLIPFARGAKA